MTRQPPSHPTRLVDLPPGPDPANLGVLLRSALRETPEDTPTVRWRIRSTLRRQAEWRRRTLRFALVGGAMFVTGGVVGAVVVQPILASRARLDAAAKVAATPPSTLARRAHRSAKPSPPAPAVAPPGADLEPPGASPAPAATTEPVGTPVPTAAAAPAATRAPSPPRHLTGSAKVRVSLPEVAVPATAPTHAAPVEAFAAPLPAPPVTPPAEAFAISPAPAGVPMVAAIPIEARQVAVNVPPARRPAMPSAATAPVEAPAEEQVSFAKAFRELRIARNPRGALAALDEYGARFPAGVLAPEASRLRTEALLLLGRKDAALAELDRESSDGMPDSDDRRLLRGELRAKAGRWQAALEDFDTVVRGYFVGEAGTGVTVDAKARERLERALWGRALSRSHLGDGAGARADLRAYLGRFPHGRFADDAARLLGGRR